MKRQGKSRSWVLPAAAALTLGACHPASSQNDQSAIKEDRSAAFKPIDGYRDIKLGATFEETMNGGLDPSLFNPYGLRECFHDIALRGCGLSRKSDDTVWEMRNGIPYALEIALNRNDRITDVGLNYHREAGITAQQCRDIFAKTIDWVSQDYGPVDFRREGDKRDPKVDADWIFAKSPAGNAYAYLKPSKDGSYVSEFVHLKSEKIERVTVKGKPEIHTRNRGVRILSSFIVAGENICDVTVTFTEPDTFERRVIGG